MHLPDGRKIVYGTGKEIFAEIRIHHMRYFRRCVFFGAVGFGESYVDGDWSTDNITAVISWMIINHENHPTMSVQKKWKPVNFLGLINILYGKLRENTLKGSRKNISAHYDLSNDFFKLFLDSTMTYSAAYFKDAQQSLEDAQVAKYDLLCRKLRLHPQDQVLEIGSGWGGFAEHAVKKYGCRVTTITISQEQYEYAKQRFQRQGLNKMIDIKLMDYRQLQGRYDKIVSIEMIEAVGYKYLDDYFKTIHRLLKKDGVLALQMILFPDHRYEIARKSTDWIQKYIFPGSLLPSVSAVQKAINRTGTLNLFHLEDMTMSYAKTLNIWHRLFNQKKDEILKLGMDEEFIRKWNYYLCYCEAAFNMRNISVVQAVYSRPNNLKLNNQLEFALTPKDREFVEQL